MNEKLWPSNSPDLNPVDYAACSALQQRVYRRRKFNRTEESDRPNHRVAKFHDSSIYEWRRSWLCCEE